MRTFFSEVRTELNVWLQSVNWFRGTALNWRRIWTCVLQLVCNIIATFPFSSQFSMHVNLNLTVKMGAPRSSETSRNWNTTLPRNPKRRQTSLLEPPLKGPFFVRSPRGLVCIQCYSALCWSCTSDLAKLVNFVAVNAQTWVRQGWQYYIVVQSFFSAVYLVEIMDVICLHDSKTSIIRHNSGYQNRRIVE
jgi:hypothetical protein